MTYIQRNENLATKNSETAPVQDFEGSEGFPDPYPDFEDPALAEAVLAGEDAYTEEELAPGLEALGEIPQDADGMRQWLIELKDSGQITRSEYQSYLTRVNSAVGLLGQGRETALAKIGGEISAQFAEQVENETADSEPAPDLKDLKREIERAIQDIEDRSNLTADEKIELTAPLERQLTELGLAEDEPDQIDAEAIRAELEETVQAADEQDAYSPGLKGLAEAFGLEPEVIKGKAEAKGIDLANLALPPSEKLLNFLAEQSPELKAAFEKVETAVNERTKFYEQTLHQANQTNDSNNNSTTDRDNTDISPWQTLFDLKQFQDEKSQAVMGAKQEAVQALLPLLKSLFPDKEIKAVESEGKSGWEKTQADYGVADKIKIGSQTFDLFNNLDGTIYNTGGADGEIKIEIPEIYVDGEGDGEWDPPDLQTYGKDQLLERKYDRGGDGRFWDWF